MGIKDLPRNLEPDFTLEYPFTGLAKACAHLTPDNRLEPVSYTHLTLPKIYSV